MDMDDNRESSESIKNEGVKYTTNGETKDWARRQSGVRQTKESK